MNIWDNIVRFFQGGGEFMFPIALVFVVGLAIALERYVYLVHAAVRNRGLWNEIVPLLSQGNFRQVAQATAKSPSAIGRSEEHTSELQSQSNLVCRLLLEKKKKHNEWSVLDHP